MKQMIRRVSALLLALAMTLGMTGASAEGFTPGDMLPTLYSENVAAGREIAATFRADAALVPNIDAQALSALLSVLELEARYYDDFGTACVGVTLRMQDEPVASVNARIEQDGTIRLVTSLVPDKTLVLPGEWLAQYSGLQQGPAMQAFKEALPLAYLNYFYRLGGWVSTTQYWNEDLYVSVDEQVPATPERDEVSQAMQYRVQNFDFVYLLDSITFYFRDEDKAFQQVIADMLAEQGVTRGQLRAAVDAVFTREELNGPDHWITRTEYLTEEQLAQPVTVEDVYYMATHMAFSVRTCMDELIEGATEFRVSEGTDYQTVGFDGTMPQMWKDFPFKNGALTYNRKTLEGEGVHHTAQGHMDLIQSGYAVDGDLDFYWAEKNPEDFENTFTIGMDFVRERDQFGFDAQVRDHLFLDGEKDVREINAALELYKDSTLYALAGELRSETAEKDGDFENETHLRLTMDGLLDVSAQVRIASGEYQETAFPETAVNLESAAQEEIDQLQNEWMLGVTQALYTVLSQLPAEAAVLLQ